MTKTATKTHKASTKGYDLDAGVGVNWATNDYGWGLNEMPHMAVLLHPLQGMTLWGPFVNEDAAHAWIRLFCLGRIISSLRLHQYLFVFIA